MGSCSLTRAEQQLKMGKGQNEGGFSEEQLQMYKDCFKLMDINKDGQLDKNDLRGAFDNVGVLMSESELDGPRLRSPPLLRRPLRPSLRRTPTPRRRRRRRRRPPSKLAPFSTFPPRLWPTLTSRPTLKTPHSKQDTDNMGAEIIQTILSPGI